MTIDIKRLREPTDERLDTAALRANFTSHSGVGITANSVAAWRLACPPGLAVMLLDEIEMLRAACQKWQDFFTETPGLAAANAEVVSLRSKLAAMTAARDRACKLAEAACGVLVDFGDEFEEDATGVLEDLAELRKVGAQ